MHVASWRKAAIEQRARDAENQKSLGFFDLANCRAVDERRPGRLSVPCGNSLTSDARKQIEAASIDAAERARDISCTVDPGHRLGERYERAAKHRSRRRAF
jgi:hypothetical protein